MSLHGVDSEGLTPTNTLQVASEVAVKVLGLRQEEREKGSDKNGRKPDSKSGGQWRGSKEREMTQKERKG